MMQVEAAQYSSASQILASARAVRSRIMSARPYVKPKPVTPPLWKTRYISFDAHVRIWQAIRAEVRGCPKKMFAVSRCNHYGVTLAEIKGRRGKVRVCRARQAIAWETLTRFECSLPELGRLFDRDHTTILHSTRVVASLPDTSEAGLLAWINSPAKKNNER